MQIEVFGVHDCHRVALIFNSYQSKIFLTFTFLQQVFFYGRLLSFDNACAVGLFMKMPSVTTAEEGAFRWKECTAELCTVPDFI